MADLSNVASPSKSSKRKGISSNLSSPKNTKRICIDKQENNLEIEERHQLMLIEIEERKMSLQERVTADRKAQMEIEKIELENMMMRKKLSEN